MPRKEVALTGILAVMAAVVLLALPAFAQPWGLDPANMSVGQLIAHLGPLNPKSPEATTLSVALFTRFSLPCATFVAALVSTPLAIMFTKRGPYIGVALSVIIVFLYYTAMQTTRALGEAGHLMPFLAAWLPNIVFGAVGVGLMARVERI